MSSLNEPRIPDPLGRGVVNKQNILNRGQTEEFLQDFKLFRQQTILEEMLGEDSDRNV